MPYASIQTFDLKADKVVNITTTVANAVGLKQRRLLEKYWVNLWMRYATDNPSQGMAGYIYYSTIFSSAVYA